MFRHYSLRKSRSLFHRYIRLYRRKQEQFSSRQSAAFLLQLKRLETFIWKKEKAEASKEAKRLVQFCEEEGIRSWKDKGRDLFLSLSFALLIALAIRLFWFELYEVPTGSMRPTIMELDRLAVSKTTFGIPIPFSSSRLFYHPDRIQRGAIITFTSEGMGITDSTYRYFHLITGNKRFVKRAISRPGDTLYFYGGQIYGIDAEGQPITSWTDTEFLHRYGLEHLDHVPYITYQGKSEWSLPTPEGFFRKTLIRQMNLPVASIEIVSKGKVESKFFNGHEWVADHPEQLRFAHSSPVSYSDLWGLGNYAMVRLLSAKETHKFYGPQLDTQAPLFLEIHHTPNLTAPPPLLRMGQQGKIYPMISPFTALLPLGREELETLQHALSTARFCVKKGSAFPYQKGRASPQPKEFDISLPQVPDGCYEWDQGTAYRIYWGGWRKKLSMQHPLYDLSLLPILFNAGEGWNRLYETLAPYQPYHPHRYAYFRDGNLYVMGAPILTQQDERLKAFLKEEQRKEAQASAAMPYIGFVDRGPPLKPDGTLDVDKILAFGLHIPDDAILALGDNYPMSEDCRSFGFVPIKNLRGGALCTFWPLSTRIGALPQPVTPWFTLPNLIIGSIVTTSIALTILYYRRRNRTRLFPD